MSEQLVIEIYRGLSDIEDNFKVSKSNLDIRPVHVSRQDRITTHVLTCFISLVILHLIQKKTDYKFTPEQIITCLNGIICRNEHTNLYIFNYRSYISDQIGKVFGIDFTNKRLRLSEIKNCTTHKAGVHLLKKAIKESRRDSKNYQAFSCDYMVKYSMVMSMDCVGNLLNVIDYCENNLDHEISLEEMAFKAGYSVFHFCRLFQLTTGYAPKEYIRKRRLSRAAVELYNTGGYIKNIGYKWGFNSHENFVRAFRKQFGVSPSQYRECKSSLNLFHRIERIENRFIQDLGLTPEFIDKPSFKLAGFLCPIWKDGTNNADIPKHWNTYHGCKLS